MSTMAPNVYNVAEKLTNFNPDNKTRAQQQTEWLGYSRELTTRMPATEPLNDYRRLGFSFGMLDISEATPTGETSETHDPTRIRHELAIVLRLTIKGTAAMIVQEADDSKDGVAIFETLTKAYGQSDDDGMACLQQLKELAFNNTNSAVLLATQFKKICINYRNITGSDVPNGIKRQSIMD